MPRIGLSKERVVKSAVTLIEQSGAADFSMRALADSLNIKTASLYNHVKSMDELMVEVCACALRMQRDAEMNAIEEAPGEAGIMALANAYRRFAKEHRELYRLIMNTAVSCGNQLDEISQCIVEPFMKVLEHTSLNDMEKMHWQRVLRGIVHGFVSQEDAGFFSHLPVDADDSFRIAIKCYINGLMQTEVRNNS